MKLQDENKLTDVDLEQVVGGDDIADDSRFLNVLLQGREGQCERYGSWRSGRHFDEVARAWRSVGVDCGWDDDEAWLLGEEDVVRCEGDKGGERWWLGGEVVRLE